MQESENLSTTHHLKNSVKKNVMHDILKSINFALLGI